jgi:nicotinamidase-related amidase
LALKSALLILDMLNTFDFPEGKVLAKRSLAIARNISRLKQRCLKAGVPVIYVNDNFGEWHSDWKKIYVKCTSRGCRGREIAEILKPESDDLFVLKPKHSGFYSTNLEPLLKSLKVKRLILTGIAGDICVLFTAYDAHMREFDLFIPKDCVASNTKKGDQFLIYQFDKTLKFPVGLARDIRFHR